MYKEESFPMNMNKERIKTSFARDVDNKERAFYSGRIRYSEMIDFLRESDCIKTEDIERKELLLALYQGMKSHENVNIDAVRARLFLTKAAEDNNKEYLKLTDQDVKEAFEGYERRAEMEANENESLNFYEKALENWSDTFYIKRYNIETLICDIKYRQAKRIVDADKREEALVGLNGLQRNIAADIPDKGLRAEVQLTGLINQWAEKQGKGHLIEAYSALPLDDHKEKIDIEIAIGREVLNVNLKSYKASSYLDDFNSALVNKEKNKIKGNRVSIVVLDSDELQEAWRLSGENEQTDSDKRRFKKLMNSIVGKMDNDFLLKLFGCVKKKEEKKNAGITRKQLFEKHSNVSNLLQWGYLKEEETGDIDAIMSGKNKLKEDLKDVKIFKKLKFDV